MSEFITVTIKEIHCIKRSEFKGRADEIYLKQRGSHEWLWPTHKRAERIKKGHSVRPDFHYYYRPNEKDATLELWEHDKATKDDFLGSITFNSDSQGEHSQFMDGDGGSYRVIYSVNNPFKNRQAPAVQDTKPEKAELSGVSGQSTDPSSKTATMKRLVVCCDGTWQDLEQIYPTNVVKTVQIVKPVDSKGINQVVYYHEGVGAESNISKDESFLAGTLDNKMTSVLGGALGKGIDRNIQDAYRFLCINYSPGDEIYLFGFSRGSYTVRSLAGLLSHCGLLKREFLRDIPKAYENYRKQADRDSREMIELIPHCHPNAELDNRVPITLLACYDTVGSLGVPDHFHHIPIGKLIKRGHYAFHDTVLSRHYSTCTSCRFCG